MLFAGSAHALDPSRPLDQFAHSSWTLENGAPSDIWALAETADGYLWIGSSRGLYRFDGVTFEKLQGFRSLPARSDGVSSLLATPTGELWIGHLWGGISVYRNGKLEDVNPAPPHGVVVSIVQDPGGGIWAATTGIRYTGLRHFYAGKWDIIESGERGLPKQIMTSMLAARDGALWISFDHRLVVRLPPGGQSFEPAEGPVGESPSLGQAADGGIWLIDDMGVRPFGAAPRDKPSMRDLNRTSFIADRDGSLWTVSNNRGVIRIRHPDVFAKGPAEREENTARSQILSNAAGPILEDREGNIWIATSLGIDRFTASNFVTQTATANVPLINGTGRVVRTADGDVYSLWLDADEHLLFHDHDGALNDLKEVSADAKTMCAARDGGLWVINDRNGFLHVKGKKIVATIPAPEGLKDPAYRNCSEDGAGRLWVAIEQVGLLRFDGQAWSHFDAIPEMKTIWPWLQEVDPQGRVLMYFATRALIRVDGDKVEMIWDQNQIPIRFIQAIYVAGDQVFLCGEGGLALYDGKGGFKFLDSERFPFLDQLSGIAQTESGETWMLSSAGVIRIASADLRKAFDHPEMSLQPRIFDFRDGLRGQGHFGESNAVAAARDGRVWFNTTGGLIWLDSEHIYHNYLPPVVLIHALTAEGVAHRPTDQVQLPQGASNLQFDYTALSLTAPDRVMFRYRLDGVDKDWVEAGTRRQAFYTNLAPGAYHFQVIASNNDGVWNTVGASMDFEIPPRFTQSRWFLWLCVLSMIAVLWLLYHLRVSQLAARLRLRMNVRIEERERIARELHDTLLQGVQGLIFRFQAIAAQISADQPARREMEHALDKADEMLAEGRDRVVNLRASEADGNLSRLLDAAATRILSGSGIEVSLTAEGARPEIAGLVAEEIVRIGGEFLFNTLQHAEAGKVRIMINYGRRALKIQFGDDGRGVDPSILQGGRDGHFGLTGMRERAEKIGGTFSLTSRPGAGVALTITIPATAAYLRLKKPR